MIGMAAAFPGRSGGHAVNLTAALSEQRRILAMER
jgi:hypothetical protein